MGCTSILITIEQSLIIKLQLNIPTVEKGESVPHRSQQNGTYITENKCWLQSAWQTKEKHMQRNMIMLISCQGLCLWASYVNYTTGYICNAWVFFSGSFPVDGFAEIHFMTLNHLEELVWLTESRAEKVTVFVDDYYVEKKNSGNFEQIQLFFL